MGFNMLSRALLVAVWCAYASALAPLLPAAADDNDCALYISGPGRTSAYDYSLNLLKGNFGYEGQHTCITYDAVNQAYLEARNRIVVSQPKGEWKPEDFASVGELVLDISINLARRYGLTYEEIEKGLPLIDTSRTLIREVCPPVFSHVECRAGKYRRLDGLCNNLEHPTWGATNAPFQRLIGPLFADGINAPRISHTGRDLPLSRVVSRTMHPDDGFHDHAGTVMVIAWGQFMDHDYTLTGTPLDPRNRNDPEECCKRPQHLKHPYCNEILIPDDDYFYRLFSVKCIDFVRAFPSPRPGCRLGSRVPFNTLTGSIDGNTVYGVTDKFARKLRTGYGGLLRMNPVFKEYGLKDLLPLKLDIPDEGCTRPNKNMYCFEAGEIRVNEQLVLTVMHTLMAREHNRVAEALAAVNPHWDDETLYQEARRINIAEIQHITYNEFLPILLGKDVMEKFGLVVQKEGYWDGYDPNVNPDVIDAFASAAYRFGHSLLPTAVERWSKAHKFIASKRLSDLIRRPYDLYRAGVLDEYVMGLMNQVAQAMDDSITQEVTNHLFKKVGARFGMDLVSFNMQRGREFGIPGYMEFRKFCGLSGANSFQDLFGSMSNETVLKYETIFEHPIDVDLWSGGVSERPLPGSMLGPTFACVIATQFSYSKRGDRFWYELPNQPSSFTPEQLAEIRKARLSRVICDNTDIIDTVQLYPMVLPDHELNPRVPCKSGIIPQMDFSKWAEPAPASFPGAKQFITEALTVEKNVACECEQTVNDTQNANNTVSCQDVANVQLIVSVEALKASHGKSEPNCNEISTNCAPKAKSSIVLNSNTIPKYVYETNEKVNKTKGHPKNSLKRRRRETNKIKDYLRYAASAPVIVDYKTSHDPGRYENLQVDPDYKLIRNANLEDFSKSIPENVGREPVNTNDIIRKENLANFNIKIPSDVEQGHTILGNIVRTNLADFNIETLHGNDSPPNNVEVTNENPKYFVPHDIDSSSREESDENDSKNNEDHRANGDKNTYQDNYKRNNIKKSPRKPDEHKQNSREIDEADYPQGRQRQYSKPLENSNERRENDRSDEAYTEHDRFRESDDSGNDKIRSSYSNPKDESLEDKRQYSEGQDDHILDNKDIKYTRPRDDISEKRLAHPRARDDNDENRLDYRKSPDDQNETDDDSGEARSDLRQANPGARDDNDENRSDYRKSPDDQNETDDDSGEVRSDLRLAYLRARDGNDENRSDYRKSPDDPNETDDDSGEAKSDLRLAYPRARDDNDENISDNDEKTSFLIQPQESDERRSEYPEPRDESDKKSAYLETHNNDSDKRLSDTEPLDDDRGNGPAKTRYDDSSRTRQKYPKSHDNSDRTGVYFKPRDGSEDFRSAYSKPRYDVSEDKTAFSQPRVHNRYGKANHNRNSANAKPLDESYESRDKEYHSRAKPIYQKKRPNSHNFHTNESPASNESEEEDMIIILKNKNKNPPRSDYVSNIKEQRPTNQSPVRIQDVDLRDFSFERIQLNDKGKVESVPDTDENYDDITPLTTVQPVTTKFEDQYAKSIDGRDIPLHDEEVKPVIEINRDRDNSGSSEENSKESVVEKTDNDEFSLETVLGVKEESDEQNDKLVAHPENQGDVKQEFERIPLNYNHEKKKTSDNKEPAPVVENEKKTEGTLDLIQPTRSYDEHLNIKFEDIAIKLPEINLPEDILAYPFKEDSNKKSTENGNKKNKPKFYQYSDEYNDEYDKNIKYKLAHKKNHDDEEDDHDEASDHYENNYRSKFLDNLKKKKNIDDDEDYDDAEDLYEKFVQERFGKKGSFKKRSEAFHERPVEENTELFHKLQHVLKKTDDIQKQAADDPNAGYMWTLEYGRPL